MPRFETRWPFCLGRGHERPVPARLALSALPPVAPASVQPLVRRQAQAEGEEEVKPLNQLSPTSLLQVARKMRMALLEMPEAPEHLATDDGYTDYCTGADGTRKQPYQRRRNRQCSIGWHGECSDPKGESCGCPCHWLPEDEP